MERKHLIGLVCGLLACDPASQQDVADDEAFEDAVSLLGEAHGDGKADLLDILGVDVCEILEPVLEFGEPSARLGYVIGAEGTGTLPGVVGVSGYDIVWDLYHHQLAAHQYRGGGLTSNIGPATGVGAYAGMAFNFQNGVGDWEGYFVTGSANIGLPYLREYGSLDPIMFVSGKDHDGDGHIDALNEIDPYGVNGFAVGVSTGATLIPDPLPVSGNLTSARWSRHDSMTRALYDELADVDIRWAPDPVVRLVDPDTGAECLETNPDWPDPLPGADGEIQDCVIEFGDPEDSHLRRAVDDSMAMCHFSGGCAIPLAWPAATVALAVGLLRDQADKLRKRCDIE